MSVYDEKPWLSLYDPGQPGRDRAWSSPTPCPCSGRRSAGTRTATSSATSAAGSPRVSSTSSATRSRSRWPAWACAPATGWRCTCRTCRSSSSRMLATWKAGGIAVPVNPMNRARELDAVLRDSGARVLVCLEGLYRDVAAGVVEDSGGTTVDHHLRAGYRARDDPRVFAGIERLDLPDGAHDMAALIERHRGQAPGRRHASDPATPPSSPTPRAPRARRRAR